MSYSKYWVCWVPLIAAGLALASPFLVWLAGLAATGPARASEPKFSWPTAKIESNGSVSTLPSASGIEAGIHVSFPPLTVDVRMPPTQLGKTTAYRTTQPTKVEMQRDGMLKMWNVSIEIFVVSGIGLLAVSVICIWLSYRSASKPAPHGRRSNNVVGFSAAFVLVLVLALAVVGCGIACARRGFIAILTVLSIDLLLFGFCVMFARKPQLIGRATGWILALFVALAGAGWGIALVSPARPVELLCNISKYGGANTTRVYLYTDSLTGLLPSVTALAFSLTLLSVAEISADRRENHDELVTDTRRLAQSLLWQRVLLYVSAFALVALVVQNNLLWRWPAVWAPSEEVGKWVEELALRNSTSLGALYSFLTLALFVPSHLILQEHVRALARANAGDKSPEDWLKKHDLSLTFGQQMTWFAAALGPALAGGPLAALVSSLGGGK